MTTTNLDRETAAKALALAEGKSWAALSGDERIAYGDRAMFDEWGAPVHLEAGVRCGSHGYRTYHENADAVRRCYAVMREQQAEQAAEQAAERANERYFEDRGYWEARAQEDYEARNGVIPFDQAYRNACPEAFADEA